MNVAIAAFEKLAENNVAEACQYLGLIYRTGDGVDQNNSTSQRWYSKYVFLLQRQSKEGNQLATYSLATLYQYGEHVCKDENKALNLFFRLASEGFSEAQYALATFFLNGWCNCEKNKSKYKFWLEKSAASDHPEAMYYYGRQLIEEGNFAQGKELLLKAAVGGCWLAKDFVSDMR